ncbi:hypothetical protein LYNGBM3L_60750 [Moorena producens 3L]|uniref:Uncharacterized protein n=1 Tax=Moorena producens 3L TaxID=489825 RepID=F4Y089_9CYAN|nr:hypothetical protein LYNGBM3L_60750 [Moorena producens 3L]
MLLVVLSKALDSKSPKSEAELGKYIGATKMTETQGSCRVGSAPQIMNLAKGVGRHCPAYD